MQLPRASSDRLMLAPSIIRIPHSETQNEDDRWYLHTLEAGSNNVKLQRAFVVGLGGSLRACAVSQRLRKTIYIYL